MAKMDNNEEEDDIYEDVDDDLRFKSVNSLLCLVKLVYEYIECAGKLPPIAYDVENKLIELFTHLILKHVNWCLERERCKKLISKQLLLNI